jgi:hypothetical protein
MASPRTGLAQSPMKRQNMPTAFPVATCCRNDSWCLDATGPARVTETTRERPPTRRRQGVLESAARGALREQSTVTPAVSLQQSSKGSGTSGENLPSRCSQLSISAMLVADQFRYAPTGSKTAALGARAGVAASRRQDTRTNA